MKYAILLRDMLQIGDGDHSLIKETGISHALLYYPFHGHGKNKMEILSEIAIPEFGLTRVSPLIPKTKIVNDTEKARKLADDVLALGKFDEIYIEPAMDFPENLDSEKCIIDAFLNRDSKLRIGVLANHYCWLGKCAELLAVAPNTFPVPVINDENMALEEIFQLFKTGLGEVHPLIVSLSTESKIDLPYLLDEYRAYIPEVIFWSPFSLRDLNLPALKEVTLKKVHPENIPTNTYVATHSVAVRNGASMASMMIANTNVSSTYLLEEILPEADGFAWARIKDGGWVCFSQNGNLNFEKKIGD
jgi:hypothetical protein